MSVSCEGLAPNTGNPARPIRGTPYALSLLVALCVNFSCRRDLFAPERPAAERRKTRFENIVINDTSTISRCHPGSRSRINIHYVAGGTNTKLRDPTLPATIFAASETTATPAT